MATNHYKPLSNWEAIGNGKLSERRLAGVVSRKKSHLRMWARLINALGTGSSLLNLHKARNCLIFRAVPKALRRRRSSGLLLLIHKLNESYLEAGIFRVGEEDSGNCGLPKLS